MACEAAANDKDVDDMVFSDEKVRKTKNRATVDKPAEKTPRC